MLKVRKLNTPRFGPKKCRSCRACVEANFDINKLNNRLVEIYQELFDGKIKAGIK